MPKQHITREMILNEAFALAREAGPEQVLVKNVARRLGCSVQPLYSYFTDMGALRAALAEHAGAFVRQYVAQRVDPADPFRTTGLAYMRLAREEPHLYRLYMLRSRAGLCSFDDVVLREGNPAAVEYLVHAEGLTARQARRFYADMLVYNLGVSVMLATKGCELAEDEVWAHLDNVYTALLANAKQDGKGKNL